MTKSKRKPSPASEALLPQDDELRIEADVGDGLKIATVGIDRLREQDMNARTMPPDMFQQLVKNIEHRGALESLPYCVQTDKADPEIVSGHHRIRAARVAGLRRIPILLDTANMSRSEITAKQLAHNSLAGIDDPVMLRRLYELIDDADLRRMAYVDESALNMPELPATNLAPLEIGMEMQHVSLFFLPHQLDKFGILLERLGEDEKMVLLADLKDWDKFAKAIRDVIKECEIRALGTVVSKMVDLVNERLDQIREEKGDEQEDA